MQFDDATLGNRAIRKWSVSGTFEGGTEYVRADQMAEAVAIIQRLGSGWANAVELEIIPERHTATARMLAEAALDFLASQGTTA